MTPENHNDNNLVKPDRTWPRWTVISGAAAALAAGAVGFSMLGGNVQADLPDSIRLTDRVTVTEASDLGFPIEVVPNQIVPLTSNDSPFDSAASFQSADVGAPSAAPTLPAYVSSYDSPYDSPAAPAPVAPAAPVYSYDSPDDSPYVVPAPVYSYDSVSADSIDSFDSVDSTS